MKIEILFCTTALMILSMPILALQDSGPNNKFDLGVISNQIVNISQNGALEYPGDIGWFIFQVVEPLNFVFSVNDYDEDYAFVLYDEEMNYLDSGERALMVNLTPGSYYLRVEAIPFKTMNFTLKGSAVRTEIEPNDGIGDAMDIGSLAGHITLGGEIDSQADTDFFKFKIDDGKEGVFEADINPSYMLNLVLYGFNNSKNRYEIIESQMDSHSKYLSAGEYILRLDMNAGDASYYYSDNHDSESTLKYILDINLYSLNATSLGVLNRTAPKEASGYLRSSDIKDYYSFEVEEAVPIVIETSGESGDSTLQLEDEDHKILDYNDDHDGRWSLIEYELQPGKYFVVVGSFADELSYDLTIKLGEE